MFCFHKYGKREKEGYQYCEKCGKAHGLLCFHVWKLIKETAVYPTGTIIIRGVLPIYHDRLYECKVCGVPMVKRV
jgi:ribosomal protein L37E